LSLTTQVLFQVQTLIRSYEILFGPLQELMTSDSLIS
jgi:hypothetical protein